MLTEANLHKMETRKPYSPKAFGGLFTRGVGRFAVYIIGLHNFEPEKPRAKCI